MDLVPSVNTVFTGGVLARICRVVGMWCLAQPQVLNTSYEFMGINAYMMPSSLFYNMQATLMHQSEYTASQTHKAIHKSNDDSSKAADQVHGQVHASKIL
eukprot:CAMPEP_0202922812 /NCGR_PEP_ID=MMETSP1392-20130828/78122_1 /ASSEMBLY_ACC=CAM_ASM_000868 /TAXON_ID=225041 /ORGANISM="Chlamydomonas chlamydogama, Strain SAG 11-48b" /LENGTH=99 /DNA_ID=CAMNT_0049616461 /DNA_START=938 /DNA_END=1237 /DNA_ORIENTATION=+